MNGQGRPHSRLALRILFRIFSTGLVAMSCCAFTQVNAGTTSVRVRFEWQGPEPALWVGSISLPGGSFTDVRLLGLDPDQPGAFVNQGDRVLISPRFATQASGFEAMISGEDSALIQVALGPESGLAQNPTLAGVSLSDVLQNDIERELGQGHKLTIRRVAGDEIRVKFPRNSMVFKPGENPKIDIRPMHVDAKPGSALRIRLRIKNADESKGDVAEFWQLDEDLWSRTETIRVDELGNVDPLLGIQVPIPDGEGSYNLSVDLTHRLPAVGMVARRTVQFVVVDPRRPPLYGNGEPTEVANFNPADPDWRDYLTQLQSKSALLPGLKKGPWSNTRPYIRELEGAEWTHLQSDGWVAYSLNGAKPNTPHVLEVNFPPGMGQDVGISIVEPKSLENVEQLHREVAVSIGDRDLMLPGVAASSQNTRQRVVFWPSSSSPVVVISNRSSKRASAFGAIRLEAYQQGLPVRPVTSGSRKRIAVLDGQFLQMMFQSDERTSSDEMSDSWRSFLLAGTRLVSYLRYAGYDGATLKVVSNGSTLFPSQLLLPTGKLDRGVFDRNRRDPFQKDVLALLFDLFDREGLVLFPALEFATPLPELEELIFAEGQAAAVGVELLDSRNHAGAELPTDASGLAPYYNPLDQRVQKAIARVFNELLQRYSHHTSFRGFHLDCHSQGFMQLPGAKWAFDDATIAAFVAATNQNNPNWNAKNVSRALASQLEEETSSDLTAAWLQWRANRLSGFYRNLAELVGRDEKQLFVSLTGLMQSQPWQRRLRPALPREASVKSVLLELGLDIEQLQQSQNLIVMRPNRIAPLDHLGSQAINLEASEQDIQQSFQSSGPTAVQFDYQSQVVQHDGFDTNGPTRKHHHQFLTTSSRGGVDARRHLALSLAQQDDEWIFEGGEQLAFGQEKASSGFFDVFRKLPNQPFEEIEFDQSGPVVARVATILNETIVYFVNTSPWEATTGIQWRAPRDVTVKKIADSDRRLEPADLGDRSNLELKFEPYGIVALRFDSPRVELIGCRTELPAGIAQQLRVQLDEIVSRGKQIESRDPAGLLRDPSFEEPLAAPGAANGSWFIGRERGGNVAIDADTRAHGNQSLRLKANNPNSSVVVTSHSFPAPETGRLVVSLKVRNAILGSRPPIMLRLESSSDSYQPFHLFEEISVGEFSEEGVSFVDIPTDPDLQLRISIELAGPGDVWIDELRTYDRWILKDEKKNLAKILHRAVTQEEKGDLAACLRTLSGYWPRFLLRHVPPARLAVRIQPRPAPKQLPAPKKESKFLRNLRRFVPRL